MDPFTPSFCLGAWGDEATLPWVVQPLLLAWGLSGVLVTRQRTSAAETVTSLSSSGLTEHPPQAGVDVWHMGLEAEA